MSKNLSDKYYQENKERLQKKACEGYQNLSDDEKQKFPEYRKKYYRIGKKWYIPYSLIFKLEDSKDSKDSNCVCHNKYIRTQRKEVNRSHFLS